VHSTTTGKQVSLVYARSQSPDWERYFWKLLLPLLMIEARASKMWIPKLELGNKQTSKAEFPQILQ
jgi:hypothetical protein